MGRADDLLALACNRLRSLHDRRVSWDAYLVEREYELVHSGRIRLRDVPISQRSAVYQLIVERQPCISPERS